MKVNLYTNYAVNNKINQQKSQNAEKSYVTNVQPLSFGIGGFTKLGKIGAAAYSTVTGANSDSERVMQKLNELYVQKYSYPNEVAKRYLDNIRKNIITDNEDFDKKIAQFANSLVNRLAGKQKTPVDLLYISDLTDKYKDYKSARPFMDLVANEKIGDEYRFGLEGLANREGIFGNYYNGTELQNEIIRTIKDAKDLEGNPRFVSCSDIGFLESVISSEHQLKTILIPLLKQKIEVPAGKDYAKLAKIIEETDNGSIGTRLKEADKKGRIRYLILGADRGSYIEEIIKTLNTKKMQVFKAILPKVDDSKQIVSILENYTPDKEAAFQKYMQLVEQKSISIDDVGPLLAEIAG